MVPFLIHVHKGCHASGVILYTKDPEQITSFEIDILLQDEYAELEIEFINPNVPYGHTPQKERSHTVVV